MAGRKRLYFDHVPVQVYLQRDKIEEIRAFAAKEKISLSEAMRRLVRMALDGR